MVKYKLLLICILYEWNGCNNIFLYLQIYNFFFYSPNIFFDS